MILNTESLAKLEHTAVFKQLERLVIAVLIFSIFLFPAYMNPTRLENFILPLLLLILGFKKLDFDRGIIQILLLNFGIGMVSILINLNGSHGLMELIRWIKYILIAVFFSSIGQGQFRFIKSILLVTFWVMVLINLLQIINPMGLGEEMATIYSQHPLYASESNSLDNKFRLLGTAINPNNNAVLWVLMGLFWLIDFYHTRRSYSIGLFFVAFLFIIFTQSRTAIVIFGMLSLINLMAYPMTIKRMLTVSFMGLCGIFIAIYFKFTYLWHIFLYNPLEIHSLKLRFMVWRDMLKLFFDKPTIGWGHQKNYETIYANPPDNEMLYILLNQGSLGFFGMILIFIYTLFYFRKKSINAPMSSLPHYFVLAYVVIGLTNFAMMNIRTGMLFFLIWGLVYNLNKAKELTRP